MPAIADDAATRLDLLKGLGRALAGWLAVLAGPLALARREAEVRPPRHSVRRGRKTFKP
ncbi:MAG: hypothetical protein HY927_07880 [Elusimicrobia bacterium]|nr:hypothetical protein [Elusimicrobiota bacterium]